MGNVAMRGCFRSSINGERRAVVGIDVAAARGHRWRTARNFATFVVRLVLRVVRVLPGRRFPPRHWSLMLVAVLAVAATCAALAIGPSVAGAASRQREAIDSFSYVGEDAYTVPAGYAFVRVVAVGAPGEAGDGVSGGFGAVTSALLPVTPAETLYVEVGGQGFEGAGGFNGGGNGATGGGGGGGASDVRTCSITGWPPCPGGGSSLDSRVLVAGGGGAAGAPGQPTTPCSPGTTCNGQGPGGAGGSGGNPRSRAGATRTRA